jgi:hypothetical protein
MGFQVGSVVEATWEVLEPISCKKIPTVRHVDEQNKGLILGNGRAVIVSQKPEFQPQPG